MELILKQIGLIHSPFMRMEGTPIQTKGAKGVKGSVEVFIEYAQGLKDLEGFSHIILLYYFHLSEKLNLEVKPYMDDRVHGVFATRAPCRPNPLGISIVRIESIENNIINVLDIDVIDGTPLLDIKPYVPEFDIKEVKRIGWLEGKVGKLGKTRDDGRFRKD